MEWIEKRQLLEDLFIHRRDVIAHHKGHWMPRGEKWVTTPNGRKAAEEYQSYAPENGDSILYLHAVQGSERVGVYPHALNNTTKTITADFDDKKNTIEEMFSTCLSLKRVLCSNGIPSYIERSHSGSGFHVWVFFEKPIDCDLATKIMVEAFKQAGLPMTVGAGGYDRLFPCVTKVGKSKSDKKPWVGNIIGLPLQASAAAKGNCVFLNDSGEVIEDQWSFLSSIQKVSEHLVLEYTQHTEHLPMHEPIKASNGETSGWAYWRALSHIPGQFDRMKECEAIKEHIVRPNNFDNRQWALGIIANLAVFTANDDLEEDVIKFAYDIEKNYMPNTGSEDTTEQTVYARKDHLQSDEYPMNCKNMFEGAGWVCPKLRECPYNFIAEYGAPISNILFPPIKNADERKLLHQYEEFAIFDKFMEVLTSFKYQQWNNNKQEYLVAKYVKQISENQFEFGDERRIDVRVLARHFAEHPIRFELASESKFIYKLFSEKPEAEAMAQALTSKGITTYTIESVNGLWYVWVFFPKPYKRMKLINWVRSVLEESGLSNHLKFLELEYADPFVIAPFSVMSGEDRYERLLKCLS